MFTCCQKRRWVRRQATVNWFCWFAPDMPIAAMRPLYSISNPWCFFLCRIERAVYEINGVFGIWEEWVGGVVGGDLVLFACLAAIPSSRSS